jgi:hypothetical protein
LNIYYNITIGVSRNCVSSSTTKHHQQQLSGIFYITRFIQVKKWCEIEDVLLILSRNVAINTTSPFSKMCYNKWKIGLLITYCLKAFSVVDISLIITIKEILADKTYLKCLKGPMKFYAKPCISTYWGSK